VRRLLAALLLVLAGDLAAQVHTFEHVKWVSGWWEVIPGENARWTAAKLPHAWYRDPPEPVPGRPRQYSYFGFYLMQFHLDEVPKTSYSLQLLKLRSYRVRIYVNQQQIWDLSESYADAATLFSLLVPIPRGVLRAGRNTIHVRMGAPPEWLMGISRIHVGPTAELAPRAAMRNLLQGQMYHIVAAAFGAIGLLSLWMWFRTGRDPLLFWYGVSGVTLLVSSTLWYVSLWSPNINLRIGLTFLHWFGYLVPFFILHLRLAGRKHPWLEGAIWVLLIAAFASTFILGSSTSLAWQTFAMTFASLTALLAVPLLMSRDLRRQPAVILLVVADYAVTCVVFFDYAVSFGVLPYDWLQLVPFAPAFAMLAAAAPISERVRDGMRALRESQALLEQRVAEKTREIEASHEELRRVQREQALAEERRRIMADMHDGLGGRLVALLSVAQSGRASHGEISDGLAAALDELRLLVDSVQPTEGDVSVVLGSVRHRMRSVFERTGTRLVWNVSELPPMEDLTPERILAIQRIFLEVFSNAIRHSLARTVSVFTLRVPGAVRIVIEDDGRGFDAAGEHAGTGLRNLRSRAAQAGGSLEVESQPGKGTRVTLSLPLEGGEGPSAPPAGVGRPAADYPVQGMAPDPASV
jgi:signal transduction histidine kinase